MVVVSAKAPETVPEVVLVVCAAAISAPCCPLVVVLILKMISTETC